MPTPTYDLIEEKVLSSAAPSVTFNSIPGTYKDLVLELVGTVASGTPAIKLVANSDTGSNYSQTGLQGDGSTATSGRNPNYAYMQLNYSGGPNGTNLYFVQAHLMSYANTNVNKTVLSRAANASSGTSAVVNLWRSTSAITSLTISMTSGDLASGTVARLWGVSG